MPFAFETFFFVQLFSLQLFLRSWLLIEVKVTGQYRPMRSWCTAGVEGGAVERLCGDESRSAPLEKKSHVT